MTLAADIADDYTIFDNTETVTLTPKNPAGTADSSVTALRGPVTRQQAAQMGGGFVASPNHCSFAIFIATLGSTVPRPGDTITDAASVVWNVLMAQQATLQSRYDCLAVKQVA